VPEPEVAKKVKALIPIDADIAARREGVGVHKHKFFKRDVGPPPVKKIALGRRDPDG